MTSADDLEKIVDGPGSKADRARALFALGCDRADVVELLDMAYSQAHSIWKKMEDASGSSHAAGTRVRKVRQDHEADRGGSRPAVRSLYRHPLQLSPAQTRILTQDGHRVVKVDTGDGRGVICRQCEKSLQFSLRWLGFVHTKSKKDPTDIEDFNPQEGKYEAHH